MSTNINPENLGTRELITLVNVLRDELRDAYVEHAGWTYEDADDEVDSIMKENI